MASCFRCISCGRTLNTAQGLKSHITRLHKGHVPVSDSYAQTLVKTASLDQGLDGVNTPGTNIGKEPEPFHVRLGRMRRSNPVVRIIPKGARKVVAEELVKLVEIVLLRNDAAAWERLMAFTYGTLKLPGTRIDRKSSLATEVKKNLRTYMDNTEGVVSGQTYQNKPSVRDKQDQTARRVEAKIAEGDVRGAVRLLCSEDSIAEYSPETLASLQEKHPPPEPDMVFPDAPDSTVPTFQPTTVLEIIQAVSSFPNGSAGGLDGLRPQHIKNLINSANGEVATKLTRCLAGLVDLMIEGRVPEEVCAYLYGANLTALTKQTGGIRPIAVGNTIRRLAAKVLCNRIKDDMGESLRPYQLGYGTRAGAEVVVHTARRILMSETPPEVFLKLDFKNAFNTVNRGHLMQVVREKYPNIYPYVWQCYRNNSFLSFGSETIMSASGVQQGDPMGPMLFCLAIKDLTQQLKSSLNMWYLDDGTLAGSLTDVLHDVEIIKEHQARSGLCLNPTKCEALTESGDAFHQLEQVLPGIRLTRTDDITLLGSPLFEVGCRVGLERLSQTTRLFSVRLQTLNAHPALFLLKNCIGIPRLLYLLRTAPTWLCVGGLRSMDGILREALQTICNVKMEGEVWRQASLPVGMGGLGIRSVENLALPAFLSSWHATRSVVESVLAVAQFTQDGPNALVDGALSAYLKLPGAVQPSTEDQSHQRAWDNPLCESVKNQLIDGAVDLKTRARLLAVATKESGYWLQVLPSPSLGTLLNPDCLRIAVALRLGSQVCVPHKCRCGKEVDELGHHGLSCRSSAGRFPRHHALNEIVRRALVGAGVPAVLEPTGISRMDGKRPDGMSMVPWSNGRSLLWDVTCVDTLAPSHIQGGVVPGTAAEDAEDRKCQKYRELTTNYVFCPVGVETLGVFGPSCKRLLRDIGKRLVDVTGDRRSTLFLMQRFGVEVQRGNAVAILGTLPTGSAFEEIYCLI